MCRLSLKPTGIHLFYMGLNTVGLTRHGFEKERIDEIHNIYRAIYQNKMNTSAALENVEKSFKPSPDRDIYN